MLFVGVSDCPVFVRSWWDSFLFSSWITARATRFPSGLRLHGAPARTLSCLRKACMPSSLPVRTHAARTQVARESLRSRIPSALSRARSRSATHPSTPSSPQPLRPAPAPDGYQTRGMQRQKSSRLERRSVPRTPASVPASRAAVAIPAVLVTLALPLAPETLPLPGSLRRLAAPPST